MASICNDERASFGVMSGHDRSTLSLQKDERAALARELHDELGQRCTAIRIEAALIPSAAPGGQAEAAGRIDNSTGV